MFYNNIFRLNLLISKMIFINYLFIYWLKKLYNVAINLKNIKPHCEMIYIPIF